MTNDLSWIMIAVWRAGVFLWRAMDDEKAAPLLKCQFVAFSYADQNVIILHEAVWSLKLTNSMNTHQTIYPNAGVAPRVHLRLEYSGYVQKSFHSYRNLRNLWCNH